MIHFLTLVHWEKISFINVLSLVATLALGYFYYWIILDPKKVFGIISRDVGHFLLHKVEPLQGPKIDIHPEAGVDMMLGKMK